MPYVRDLVTPDIPLEHLPPDPFELPVTRIRVLRHVCPLKDAQIIKSSYSIWALPLIDARTLVHCVKPNQGRFAVYLQFHDSKYLHDLTEENFTVWAGTEPDYPVDPRGVEENLRRVWVAQEDLYMPRVGEVEVDDAVFPFMEIEKLRRIRIQPPKRKLGEEGEERVKKKKDGPPYDQMMTLHRQYETRLGYHFLMKMLTEYHHAGNKSQKPRTSTKMTEEYSTSD